MSEKKRIIYQKIQQDNRIRWRPPMACLEFFRILKFQKEKKIWSNFSFFKKIWLNLVKLLIQEVLVLLNNYSKILVLLNNYFSFFEFWTNLVKLWSNNGQTNYSIILVLLNNYFSFFKFWSNLVKQWSNSGQTMVKLIIPEILVLLNNYCFLKQ